MSSRTTRTRRFLIAMFPAAAVAAATVPANAASPHNADPITIAFESYNYGTEGLGGAGTQVLIDEFEAEHPHIDIEPSGTPVGEIHTSVQTQAAAGDPPDVVQIGLSKYAFVLENLPYVPYDDFVPPSDLEAHLGWIVPSIAAVGETDGVRVGIPYTLSTPTLLINADLVRAAGSDPDAPPETWDEAKALALGIVEFGAQGIYVDAAGESKSDFLTQTLINSAGGAVMDNDGNPTFDSPEAIEALSMLADLTASGAQPAVSESEAIALFEAGELGMLVTSTALLAGMISTTEGVFELITAGIPGFGDTPVAPTVSGAALYVFSEDPDEQAAAWEFVSFLTGDRGQIVASQIGYLPLRPAIVDAPDGLASYFESEDRLLPALEQLDDVEPYQVFPGPHGTQATLMLQDDAVAPIMLSGADPESTLTTVAAEVRSLLGR